MRFHLIDRVDAYEPGQSVRARKLTSKSETLWEDTPSGPERKQRAALLSIGDVSYVGDVVPGDILIIEGAVESMGDEVAVVSGKVTVDGKTVLEASDIMCALIDAGDLADLEDTRRLQEMLTREGQS